MAGLCKDGKYSFGFHRIRKYPVDMKEISNLVLELYPRLLDMSTINANVTELFPLRRTQTAVT
jgi:hypothetical protein